MNCKKNDIITFSEDDKVIVLEVLEYEGINYLYVDKVNKEETELLKKYHILRINKDGSFQKEVDTEVLTKLLPQFNQLIKNN